MNNEKRTILPEAKERRSHEENRLEREFRKMNFDESGKS
jgi:hypothetical protein